jgi:hypothetical protein
MHDLTVEAVRRPGWISAMPTGTSRFSRTHPSPGSIPCLRQFLPMVRSQTLSGVSRTAADHNTERWNLQEPKRLVLLHRREPALSRPLRDVLQPDGAAGATPTGSASMSPMLATREGVFR